MLPSKNKSSIAGLKRIKVPGDATNYAYSETQKYEAVEKFLEVGTLYKVMKATGIKIPTLAKWKSQDWWEQAVHEIRQAKNISTSSDLSKVVEKSISVLNDRLDNGDFHYDSKSGTIVRLGVKANVVNQVTKDLIDRKVMLDKLSSKAHATEEAIESRLKTLQDEFLKFAKSRIIEATPIETTVYKEITHDPKD